MESDNTAKRGTLIFGLRMAVGKGGEESAKEGAATRANQNVNELSSCD